MNWRYINKDNKPRRYDSPTNKFKVGLAVLIIMLLVVLVTAAVVFLPYAVS